MSSSSSDTGKREVSSPSPAFVPLGPSVNWVMPVTLGRPCALPTASHAKCTWKCPHGHTWNSVQSGHAVASQDGRHKISRHRTMEVDERAVSELAGEKALVNKEEAPIPQF